MSNNYSVVIFTSRNKDNKNILNFKQRTESFLIPAGESIYDYNSELDNKFTRFCSGGLKGEFCRLYLSVNNRDGEKVQKSFMHYLLDHPDVNLCNIQSKLASLAAQKENAITKKWLFDFDEESEEAVAEFIEDITKCGGVVEHKNLTPHGSAVVVERGFDTRELLEKWNRPPHSVTLKRDALILLDWRVRCW